MAASFRACLGSGLPRRGSVGVTNTTEALPTLRLGLVLSRARIARDAETSLRLWILHYAAWFDLGHG